MSHVRVKTTYEECGAYGSTEIIEMYCHHNLSSDCITFYDSKGDVMDMAFESWSTGKDKWDAMQRLYDPFKDKWGEELKEGVEHYFKAPWELKTEQP